DGMGRALALCPNFAAPLQHAIMVVGAIGDTASLHALAARAVASAGSIGSYARWRVAVAENDTAELQNIRGAFSAMDEGAWDFIAGDVVDNGLVTIDAITASDLRVANAATRGEERVRLQDRYALALIAGRPDEA